MELKKYLLKKNKIHDDTLDCILSWKNNFITSSNDKTIKFSNKISFNVIKNIELTESVWSLHIIDKYLIAGTRIGELYFFDLEEDYKIIKKIKITNSGLYSINSYKNYIFVASGQIIKVFDFLNMKWIRDIENNTSSVFSIIIIKNLLYSGSMDSKINIYDLEKDIKLIKTINHSEGIFRWFKYNNYLLCYEYWNNNKLFVYDIDNNFLSKKIQLDYINKSYSYFLYEDKLLIGDDEGYFYIYDISILKELNGKEENNNQINFRKKIIKLENKLLKNEKKHKILIKNLDIRLQKSEKINNSLIKQFNNISPKNQISCSKLENRVKSIENKLEQILLTFDEEIYKNKLNKLESKIKKLKLGLKQKIKINKNPCNILNNFKNNIKVIDKNTYIKLNNLKLNLIIEINNLKDDILEKIFNIRLIKPFREI